MKNNKGFSVAELLVAMAIFALATMISVSSYRNWQKGVQVTNNTDEVRSALLYAQQLSTAAAQNNTWGLHLEVNNMVIFKGSFYNENDPDNIERKLNGAIILNPTSTFATGAGGYGPDIVFYKFTGQTANTGTVSVAAGVDTSVNKSLTVESSGKINYD